MLYNLLSQYIIHPDLGEEPDSPETHQIEADSLDEAISKLRDEIVKIEKANEEAQFLIWEDICFTLERQEGHIIYET